MNVHRRLGCFKPRVELVCSEGNHVILGPPILGQHPKKYALLGHTPNQDDGEQFKEIKVAYEALEGLLGKVGKLKPRD